MNASMSGGHAYVYEQLNLCLSQNGVTITDLLPIVRLQGVVAFYFPMSLFFILFL